MIRRATNKSVRDLPLTATLTPLQQVILSQKTCGIIVSFPAAVWPDSLLEQLVWVCRVTPFWDRGQPDWSPRAYRLREACVSAINQLLQPGRGPENRQAPGEPEGASSNAARESARASGCK